MPMTPVPPVQPVNDVPVVPEHVTTCPEIVITLGVEKPVVDATLIVDVGIGENWKEAKS